MTTLYVSARASLFDFNGKQQMVSAIENFDKGVKIIDSYSYPAEPLAKVVKLKKTLRIQ